MDTTVVDLKKNLRLDAKMRVQKKAGRYTTTSPAPARPWTSTSTPPSQRTVPTCTVSAHSTASRRSPPSVFVSRMLAAHISRQVASARTDVRARRELATDHRLRSPPCHPSSLRARARSGLLRSRTMAALRRSASHIEGGRQTSSGVCQAMRNQRQRQLGRC